MLTRPPDVKGFTLESTDTLSNLQWMAVQGVGNNSVTVPTIGTGRFFRVRREAGAEGGP